MITESKLQNQIIKGKKQINQQVKLELPIELLVIVAYLSGDKLFQCFSGSRFR